MDLINNLIQGLSIVNKLINTTVPNPLIANVFSLFLNTFPARTVQNGHWKDQLVSSDTE